MLLVVMLLVVMLLVVMLLVVMLLVVMLSDSIVAPYNGAVEFGTAKLARVNVIVVMLATKVVNFTKSRTLGIYLSISEICF
jgi:hypothetical protein